MKAAVLHKYGSTPQLAEFEEPESTDGQQRISVQLAGLTPVDLTTAAGIFHTGKPQLPTVVGREGVGLTAEGERVYSDRSVPPFGAIAQFTLAGDHIFSVPPTVENEVAVTCDTTSCAR